METAAVDNISETQSQRDAELVWDHYGDVESDPLLGTENERRSQLARNDTGGSTIQLSVEDAQAVLVALDNARHILNSHIEGTQDGAGWAEQMSRQTRGWWAFHCFPGSRRALARGIFVITLILQALCVLVVSLLDMWPRNDDKSAVVVTGVIMICLQVINLFFICLVSVRLVRQMTKHKVNIFLLSQSYLATLLLFAGLYTLTYRLDRKSWRFIEQSLSDDPVAVVVLYCKFLYFSVSTATLCGSDNVLPHEWYNCIFTAIQMLLSFVYFASILGQTLSNDTKYWLGVGPDGTAASRPLSPWPDAFGHRRTFSCNSRGNTETAVHGGAGDSVRQPERKRDENEIPSVMVNVDTEREMHTENSINRSPLEARNTAPLITI